MMRRKLLHRLKEVCGATSRMMDGIDSGRTSSGRNPDFNLNFFAILASQVRCYYILYLLNFTVLQCIGQFLELYSNSRFLVYYIDDHFFRVNNWLS